MFQSVANDLVPGDTNHSEDVFVRDLQLGTTQRFDTDANGVAAVYLGAQAAVISGDGRTGFFNSYDPNLVPNDDNGAGDLFAKDLVTGAIERVNLTNAGVAVGGYFGYGYQSSNDGQRVVMTMMGDAIVGGTATGNHVFLRDRQLGTTEEVDLANDGALPNSQTWVDVGVISADGRVAAFTSYASNLVVGDTNGIPLAPTLDVFARVFDVHQTTTAYCTAKVNSLGCTPAIGVTGIASVSSYDSFDVTAYSVLNQKPGLLFWSTGAGGIPYFGGTLCAAPPVKRTTLQTSGGTALGSDCSGTYAFHFSKAYIASQSPLGAGVTVYTQYWSRDPGFAPPNNMGLSNAVAFTILP